MGAGVMSTVLGHIVPQGGNAQDSQKSKLPRTAELAISVRNFQQSHWKENVWFTS